LKIFQRKGHVCAFLIQAVCVDLQVFAPGNPVTVCLNTDSGKKFFPEQDRCKVGIRTEDAHIALSGRTVPEENKQMLIRQWNHFFNPVLEIRLSSRRKSSDQAV
jgi:hypothetical protein